ncbi:MAG: Fe-S cluster assembly protein HesB [Ignavibacteriae bacterium]|nr:Fe-S cluster assembly protein HesB [Ignavibacteriota bacterium]
MPYSIRLPLPARFHFRNTVYSHGWCALAPYRVETSPRLRLTYTLALTDGTIADIRMDESDISGTEMVLRTDTRLSAAQKREVTAAMRGCLNLELDLAPFHRVARRTAGSGWMARQAAGRLLRGASMFEDTVKMILTTNCSWSLTTAMNARLIETFGSAGPSGARAFPTPASIAASDEATLRARCSLGYRAPSVLAFARAVDEGRLDPESLRGSTAPTDELYATLLGIRGVGEYAASNLLKLLGRFDRLGLDSWCRSVYARLHTGGTQASDADIYAHYDVFGEYRGLAMWLDLTKEWYDTKFPFD